MKKHTTPTPRTFTSERKEAADIAARIERAWCIGVVVGECAKLARAGKTSEAAALEHVAKQLERGGA